jgi:hypothetical protein
MVQWENVYVFASSTFNDMHAERDYLVKQVFPRLAEWCQRRKLRLIDIDLRWGVTQHDTTQHKRVVQVCLERIDACRPFFLCLLVPNHTKLRFGRCRQPRGVLRGNQLSPGSCPCGRSNAVRLATADYRRASLRLAPPFRDRTSRFTNVRCQSALHYQNRTNSRVRQCLWLSRSICRTRPVMPHYPAVGTIGHGVVAALPSTRSGFVSHKSASGISNRPAVYRVDRYAAAAILSSCRDLPGVLEPGRLVVDGQLPHLSSVAAALNDFLI